MVREVIAAAMLAVVALGSLSSSVSACTIFSVSNGELVLVGNNEDWSHTNFTICFYPRSTLNDYGYAAFVDSENYNGVRAGMNDCGVFIDATSVRPSNVTIDPEKHFLARDMFRYVLGNCKSVNETIERFSRFNIAETWDWQLLVADCYGDSVVIAAGPDETVWYIGKNGTYQLITNGNIAYPELGQSASSEYRYNAALARLEEMGEYLSISAFRDTLDAAHSAYTAFSSVYDLVSRYIHIYFRHDYSREVVFSLDEELAKGRHHYELFRLFQSGTTAPSTATPSTTGATSTTPTSISGGYDDLAAMASVPIILAALMVVLVGLRRSRKL